MYDLREFKLKDMAECCAALRLMGARAGSMEAAATEVVRYLYEDLVHNKPAEPACALIRLFKTHAYEDLDEGLRGFARGILGAEPASPDMKCLTLLASAGAEPAWNGRHHSAGHKAIPLPSERFVEKFPMVRQLVQQLGLEVNTVLRPDPGVVVDLAQTTYNVFLVADAVGSDYVPVQEAFVIPYGIRSVLGFGGILPSGNLFAVIMFCEVPISQETADMFRTVALSTKIALLPFDGGVVFA